MDEVRIRILVVDDHPIVRRGVCSYIETQPDFEIVGEAASGEEALSLVEEHAPDLVLLDLLMPGMGGIEAIRRIKALSPTTLIAALTSAQDEATVLAALTAGASAYQLKDIRPQELIAVLRRVASGEMILEPRVAAYLVNKLRGPAPESPTESPLTPRELEVLRLLAEGLSNKEIGVRLFVSEKTVKTHVSNVLSKLQLNDRTKAAVYALKNRMI